MGTLNKRQLDFAIYFSVSRNTVQSAIDAGYSKSYAKSKGHLLLKNPLIREKVTHLSESYFKEQFKELAAKSMKELAGVIEDAENRSSQLQAIKYVLSEAGITGQSENQAGVIEIKVKLPHDL